MTALGLIVILILEILVAPLASNAQQPTKVYRIGRLLAGSPPAPTVEAFRQGLHDLGYVEGQNLIIEYRYAEGRPERFPDLAAELVQLKMDVIVAGGDAAARAAQHATSTIPIVMMGTPLGTGLVASLARPGENITGLSYLGKELPGKRLEILKETLPQSMHVAVLANANNSGNASALSNLTVAARALGLQLHVVEVRSPEEVDDAFAAMTRESTDALFVLAEPLLLDGLRGRIADLAAKHRLPTISNWRMYVDAGGLMSYGPSLHDMHRRAATYVDKLLKGAKPADLPMEQPMKFELVINLKTAKALGLTIPPGILLQADEVIR